MTLEEKEQEELDVQLSKDWEDIGGIGNSLTPEQLEHIATTMFGCPEK